MPFSVTPCWRLGALSKTARRPVRVPDAVGVKVMLIVQAPPAASSRPQLFCAMAKSPTAEMLDIVSGAESPFTGFVSVTVWALLVVPIVRLAKVRLAGDRIAEGDVRFGPVNTMVCGLVAALSVIVTAPAAPGLVGVKITLTTQLAPTATEPTQLSVSVKLPVATTLVMTSTSVPVLLSVTVCGSLVTLVNVRLAGDSPTAGPVVGVGVVVGGGVD